MGTTPRGFPYPEDTDPVAQGAQGIKALATKVDSVSRNEAAGTATAAIPNNSTWGSLMVTFPAGRFTTAPVVCGTPGDSSGQAAGGCQAYTITAASARIGVRLLNPATGAVNVPFSWIAREMG